MTQGTAGRRVKGWKQLCTCGDTQERCRAMRLRLPAQATHLEEVWALIAARSHKQAAIGAALDGGGVRRAVAGGMQELLAGGWERQGSFVLRHGVSRGVGPLSSKRAGQHALRL